MRLYLPTCESISDEVDVRHMIERLKRLPHRVMLRIPIQWKTTFTPYSIVQSRDSLPPLVNIGHSLSL
jgi:hypothetical protein